MTMSAKPVSADLRMKIERAFTRRFGASMARLSMNLPHQSRAFGFAEASGAGVSHVRDIVAARLAAALCAPRRRLASVASIHTVDDLANEFFIPATAMEARLRSLKLTPRSTEFAENKTQEDVEPASTGLTP